MNYKPIQPDDLYVQAKRLLQANPAMGKGKLAKMIGIKTPTSRRLLERFRGETQGHNNHPDYVRVLQIKNANPDWGAVKVAQALGLTLDHAKLHLARWIGVQDSKGVDNERHQASLSIPKVCENDSQRGGVELHVSVDDSQQSLTYEGTRIRTLDDLLVYTQTDTRVWEVERHVINKWEMGTKIGGEILTSPLYQIKVWLRRKVVEQRIQTLMEGMLEKFVNAAPIRPPLARLSSCKGLLEISLADIHLGKFSWQPETGHTYNADVAEKVFLEAVEDLISKSSGLPIGRVLFVCGNDFLNTDHLGRTTTAGTPQDDMLRYQESFLRGRQLLVGAIERLRQLAPVQVIMVSGNHDTQRIYYLGDVLEAWFRNTADVEVDNSPRSRKYFQFERNLIGFTHGNNEKHCDLPLLMATEAPDGWAQSRHREFHLGHFHSRKNKMFVPSYDRGGVMVRLLPSLCPPDAWHAIMGYSSKLAAEAYFWDAEEGCVATFIHSPN